MTSRKKSSGFEFWLCVIYAWAWCICPPNFAQIAISNSKLLTFSKILDGGRHHLGFSSHVNLEHSVMLTVWCWSSIKFGLNICDSHWDQHTYVPDIHLMTSRELTSSFDFCSAGHLRMAVVHLTIKFGVDICIQSRVIDISLKFKMAAAAILDFQFIWIWPFLRVDSVVFVLCTKFGSNICYGHWDRHTYASDIHLMTSRELTSGFIFASPWCIFPYNLMQDIFIQSKVIDIFPKFKIAAVAILNFQFMWICPFRRVDSVVFVFCTKFGSNICCSHWDRHTYASDIHLMTSRELTFRFYLGHVVISATSSCIFPYNLMQYVFTQSKVIDIFPKFKMAAAAILDFQFMWILPFRRVDSVVFVLCTKFGSNICYSHWDRHTYASDLHLMTSRELTSVSTFGHVIISASPWCFFSYNLMQDIFIQSKVIDIFSEIQDGGRRHLGFPVYVNLAIPACW